jgi:anti-anti-sigma factor
MLATLAVERDPDGDAAVLTVDGELDIAAAPRLRTTVGDLMGQGVRRLEVDLGRCSFIDSSGIGALLWAAHRLRAAGGELVTVHVHGATARTLELARVQSVVAVR